jgi:hypothetical protein
MKKLFTAVPMKKLLLATSLVAMSSTAIAANTSDDLDTAVTDTLTVKAKYVTPIAVGLDTTTIDFGDVWSDSVISTETVIATVTGETAETFSYDVTADAMVLLTGDINGTEVAFGEAGGLTQLLTFEVGLDTSESATTATTVNKTVTISVVYDAIADHTVT